MLKICLSFSFLSSLFFIGCSETDSTLGTKLHGSLPLVLPSKTLDSVSLSVKSIALEGDSVSLSGSVPSGSPFSPSSFPRVGSVDGIEIAIESYVNIGTAIQNTPAVPASTVENPVVDNVSLQSVVLPLLPDLALDSLVGEVAVKNVNLKFTARLFVSSYAYNESYDDKDGDTVAEKEKRKADKALVDTIYTKPATWVKNLTTTSLPSFLTVTEESWDQDLSFAGAKLNVTLPKSIIDAMRSNRGKAQYLWLGVVSKGAEVLQRIGSSTTSGALQLEVFSKKLVTVDSKSSFTIEDTLTASTYSKVTGVSVAANKSQLLSSSQSLRLTLVADEVRTALQELEKEGFSVERAYWHVPLPTLSSEVDRNPSLVVAYNASKDTSTLWRAENQDSTTAPYFAVSQTASGISWATRTLITPQSPLVEITGAVRKFMKGEGDADILLSFGTHLHKGATRWYTAESAKTSQFYNRNLTSLANFDFSKPLRLKLVLRKTGGEL